MCEKSKQVKSSVRIETQIHNRQGKVSPGIYQELDAYRMRVSSSVNFI